MKKRTYLSSMKRIIQGTNRKGAVAHIEQQHKQIAAISRLIEHGWLMVDMATGIIAIDPYLHTYYQQSIQGDETKLYRGFCQMLRLWINFQRAFKKGDLLRMIDEGDYDGISNRELAEATNRKPFITDSKGNRIPSSLPSPDLTIEERHAWLEQYIEQRYGNYADTEPLKIIVIGSNGKPIVEIIEVSSNNKISFTELKESSK